MSTEKKVDVLSLMYALIEQTRQRGGSPSVENIETARNAVVELVQAAQTALNDLPDTSLSRDRISAALARVGGAP